MEDGLDVVQLPESLLQFRQSLLDEGLDFYSNTLNGSSFAPNVLVSSATSQIGTLFFIGDYSGLAVSGDTVFPVWTDARSGNPDVFASRGELRP